MAYVDYKDGPKLETTTYEELRRAIFTRTPFKHIWATAAALFNIIRFPFWFVYYLPRATRPVPQWSYAQAIRIRLVTEMLYHTSFVEAVTPLSLEPGKEGKRWVVMQPAGEEIYAGPLRSDRTIKPQPVGGTWYDTPLSRGEATGDVLFHIHGGAMVINTGRTADSGFPASVVLKETGVTHVLMPQYRLVCNPGCRFPAALQDVVTSYHYLTHELGVPANKVIVSGDSAGGNLAIALLRYLAEYGEKVGLEAPKAAWLWSPWCDPVVTYKTKEYFNTVPNAPFDYLGDRIGTWGARKMAPDPATSSLTITTPYISQIDTPFRTVPLFVHLCGREVLFNEVMDFVKAYRGFQGNQIELNVTEYAPHDIFLAGDMLGFVKEAREAIRAAGQWTKELKGGSR